MKPISIYNSPVLRSAMFLASSTAAILLVTGSSLQAADISWDDGGVADNLWSNFNNFSDNLSPAGDNITFGTAGSSPTAGTVNSIVDTNLTIGTLRFNNTVVTDTHTLQINDGVTLTSTPGGTLNTLVIGGGNTNAAVVTSAIRGQTAGQGTLTLDNATGDMIVGFSNTGTGAGNVSTAILDMSALGSFSANIDELRIATSSSSTAGNAIGQLTLANSNSITANTIQVGGCNLAGTTGSFMRLGATNTLNGDLIVVGDSRTSATMEFRSGLTTPTVTIRGKARDTSDRADFIIGEQFSSRGLASTGGGSTDTTGTVDFRGATVTALIDELVLGWGGANNGSSNRGSGYGFLFFDAGTINAVTVHLGRVSNANDGSNDAADISSSDGTLTISGTGILLADSILMGLNEDRNSGTQNQSTGTLDVSGSATVTTTGNITLTQRTANSPQTGAGTLTITGGTVTVGGNLIEGTTVTGAGANTSTVTLNGGTLAMTGGTISVDTFNAQSGKLQNVVQLNNAEGSAVALTKTTGGTLTLDGTNTYTGATIVKAGTLALSSTGTIANSTNVTVGDTGSSGTSLNLTSKASFAFSSTQTLRGIGSVNIGAGKTVTINGTHAAGGAAATVGAQSITGDLSYGNSSTFEWDLNAISTSDPGVVSDSLTGTYDQVTASGTIGGAGSVFKVVLAGNAFTDTFWDTDKSWSNIFNASSSPMLSPIFTSFSATGGLDSAGAVAGQGSFSFTGSSLNWTAVPEPSIALVGLVLGAGLFLRRRRVQ